MADVSIVLVYPDVLGTYGDGGNARILAQRLRWRGVGADVVTVTVGTPLPRTGDIYVLGGGEDAPQALAATDLRADGGLTAATERGAAVLAVCAGLQVLGTTFRTSDGVRTGVGLVDADSTEGLPVRAVGELVVDPLLPPTGEQQAGAQHVARLSGYENHASATRLGPGVSPLGRVVTGIGNGDDAHTDGFVVGRVLGTYLHGPVLARNPDLADLLLSWVVGPLAPLDDSEALGLREERLAAATPAGRRRRA